jgi:hypothetical protein
MLCLLPLTDRAGLNVVAHQFVVVEREKVSAEPLQCFLNTFMAYVVGVL